jgi:hypothetical protein
MAASAVGNAAKGMRGDTPDVVAKILTAQGPDEIAATLRKLDAAQQREVLAAVQRAMNERAATAAVAGAGPVLTDE